MQLHRRKLISWSEDNLHLVYSTLFYISKKAPFDMFRADYKSGVKLYINRVFITDDDKELMPLG